MLVKLDGVALPVMWTCALLNVTVIVARNRLDVDGVMINRYVLLAVEKGQEVDNVGHGFTMDVWELWALLG